MKCPYCKNNLNDINFPMIEHKFVTSRDYIPDGIEVLYELYDKGTQPTKREYIKYNKEDDKKAEIKYPEYELGFSCGHCGGIITTDENKAVEILSDKTDEIYEVKYEDIEKVVNIIIEELEKQKISLDVLEGLGDALNYYCEPD